MQLLVLALLIHFSHGYMDANLFQHHVRKLVVYPSPASLTVFLLRADVPHYV